MQLSANNWSCFAGFNLKDFACIKLNASNMNEIELKIFLFEMIDNLMQLVELELTIEVERPSAS